MCGRINTQANFTTPNATTNKMTTTIHHNIKRLHIRAQERFRSSYCLWKRTAVLWHHCCMNRLIIKNMFSDVTMCNWHKNLPTCKTSEPAPSNFKVNKDVSSETMVSPNCTTSHFRRQYSYFLPWKPQMIIHGSLGIDLSWLFIYLFTPHTFHTSTKEKKPAGYKTS